MQYYRYLLMLMLLLSTNAYALQPKIEIVEQFDNLRMVTFISKKDISNSPKWNPNLEVPPLSVDGAIKAVKKFLKNSKNSIEISEVEIRPVPRHENHWHYLIKLTNNTKQTKYDIYVVLMDGKVIPAIIEPQGYK